MKKLTRVGLIVIALTFVTTGKILAQSNKSQEPEPVVSVLRVGVINIDYKPKDNSQIPVEWNQQLALSMGLGTEKYMGIFGFNTGRDLFVGSLSVERSFFEFINLGAGALYGKAHQDMPRPIKYGFLVPFISLGVSGGPIYINSKLGIVSSYKDISAGLQFKWKD